MVRGFSPEETQSRLGGNPVGRLPFLPRGRSAAPALFIMFNAAKDALASRGAQTWANGVIGRYGKVQELKIDSRLKTIKVTCQLEGEVTPIAITVENYVVEAEGGKKFIRATRFSCSRPWLQNLLMDFGPRQRVELPPWAAGAL